MNKLGKPPRWANWLAQNSTGRWAYYNDKPTLGERAWIATGEWEPEKWSKQVYARPSNFSPSERQRLLCDSSGCWWCTPSHPNFADAPLWAMWLVRDTDKGWSWRWYETVLESADLDTLQPGDTLKAPMYQQGWDRSLTPVTATRTK